MLGNMRSQKRSKVSAPLSTKALCSMVLMSLLVRKKEISLLKIKLSPITKTVFASSRTKIESSNSKSTFSKILI